MIPIQFITHYTEHYSYLDSARIALEGGCRWIQLRMKNCPLSEVEAVGRQVKALCKEHDAIFIIASDREWTISAITQLNQYEIKPILICNQSEKLSGCIYSCVCSDINASMKNLLDTLKTKDKSRIALYGINNDSISDISRVDSLLNWRDEYFETIRNIL